VKRLSFLKVFSAKSRRRVPGHTHRRCWVPRLEALEERWMPTITATGESLVAAEYLTETFVVATFTDTNPEPVSDYSASINWGDGTTSAGVISPSGSTYQVSGTVTYPNVATINNPEQITVSILKSDGETATANSTASVADVNIFRSGAITLTPTGTSSFGVAADFTDVYPANSTSGYTATIDWGDGTTTSTASGNVNMTVSLGDFTITGTHTYSGTGNFDVSVTLADDPPAVQSATSTGTAIVQGSGLSVTAGTIVATQNQPFTGTLASFTTTNTSATFTATINWGDGSNTTAGTVTGSNGNFSVTGTHTYTQAGSFTTTIQVNQNGGGSASATGTAQVNPGPLVVQGLVHKISAAGQAVNNLVVATFTDTSGAQPTSDYSATVNFGDGTSGQGTISFANGVFMVTASHTFQVQGTFFITTTITSQDGRTAQATTTAAVGWVAGIYLDLLHRPVDPTGLTDWNALLGQGLTRQQIVTDIEGSLEYRTDEVEAVYNQFLHRDADPFGLSAFVNALGSGLTLAQVQALILGSPEFFGNAGGTNTDFLTALYHDLLNRAPDSFGMSAFLDALNAGASRQSVAAAILGSKEYDQDLIESLYQQYLRRKADSFGLNAFTQDMQNGLTEEELIAVILGSQEYFNLTV
jgi:Domain of unknown function (DUF4214)